VRTLWRLLGSAGNTCNAEDCGALIQSTGDSSDPDEFDAYKNDVGFIFYNQCGARLTGLVATCSAS